MDVQDDILQELQRLKKRVKSLEALEALALLDEDNFASDSALAAASQQSIYRNVGHYGWIPAGETWTYASSTTVTISGDKTDKYSKGMKVKLTQTSVKYFYITGVSYASPNTTLTLTAGTDYTVANAAITSPFYSMVANPAGFPEPSGLLGLTTRTSTQNNITTLADLTGLSVTVTVPVLLGRKIKVEGWLPAIACSEDNNRAIFQIREGSTTLANAYGQINSAPLAWGGASVIAWLTPSAGSHTYKLSMARDQGAGIIDVYMASNAVGFISVELI
jgi:hypothetical protein